MKYRVVCFLSFYILTISVSASAQDAKPAIRFGLQVAPQQTTVEEMKEVWKEAEALGFDTLWVNDHLLPSFGPEDAPNLESWTLLAAMAMATFRVKIGAMVTSNTFRHPSEHKAYGITLPPVKERIDRLEEALEVITKLWAAEPTVSFKGQYYTLEDAPFAPKPVQKPRPPIMIGGVGEKRLLPLVARFAQMWNIGSMAPDEIATKTKALEKDCRKIKRNCAEIEHSYFTPVFINADPAGAQALLQRVAQVRGISIEQARKTILVGDPASIRQQLQAYIDVGVTHFIINLRRPGLYDREGIRLFAKEVMT